MIYDVKIKNRAEWEDHIREILWEHRDCLLSNTVLDKLMDFKFEYTVEKSSGVEKIPLTLIRAGKEILVLHSETKETWTIFEDKTMTEVIDWLNGNFANLSITLPREEYAEVAS